jgi:hypothetical protein
LPGAKKTADEEKGFRYSRRRLGVGHAVDLTVGALLAWAVCGAVPAGAQDDLDCSDFDT